VSDLKSLFPDPTLKGTLEPDPTLQVFPDPIPYPGQYPTFVGTKSKENIF